MTAKAIDPALLERPQLAADTRVHEPAADGAPWVACTGDQRYFRVEPDLARLLHALDGRRDHRGLAETLGAPWTSDDVRSAVHKLAPTGLLADGSEQRRRKSRIVLVPPLTVQFTVLKPARLLRMLRPLITALVSRAGAIAAAAIAIAGLLAIAASNPAAGLGQPLTPGVYLAVLGATLGTTAVHELAHGAMLTAFGGSPTRMGVMLFYLTPAFFCDVSDGWRLPHRRQRVLVALAGVAAQVTIAGSAAVLGLFLNSPGYVVFAVLTYTSGVLNLLPFVKFDGYLALMSHLDLPHLRDRSMSDARRFLAWALLGARRERTLPQWRWSVPFGLACLATPVVLIGMAAALWLGLLQRLGQIGGMVLLLVLGIVAYRLGRSGVRAIGQSRANGAPWWRIGVVGVGLLAAMAAALFASVPYTLSGGFSVQDGKVVLAMPGRVDDVRPGATVRLYQSGVVTRTQVGEAVVGVGGPVPGSAPVGAFTPLRVDGMSLPSTNFALTVRQAPTTTVGTAEVDAGNRPLWSWLAARLGL